VIGISEAPSGCSLGLSGKELAFLNRYITALNTAVSLAAYSLRSSGRPVYVAADVENAFQPDHTICEGGKASYSVFVTFDTALKHLKELAAAGNRAALLHPNADGHKAMARAIIAWSNSRSASPITVRGTTASLITVRNPPTLVDIALDSPFGGSIVSAGGALRVVQKRLIPGSSIQIRLDSTPRTIGSATVAEDGTIDIVIRLPEDTPLGQHHLLVFGIDDAGHGLVTSADVNVVGTGGPWLIIIAPLGLILAVLGVGGIIIGLQIRRRSGTTQSQRPGSAQLDDKDLDKW
jgi:hypothetical protein